MKKGEITVFLSLVFVLLVSFITAMLESTVIQVSKNQKRLDADQAIYSIFGEYQKELMDEYGIFAIEGSYESGVFEECRLTDRMHYYGSSGIEHEITGIQFLTDSQGQVFREAVIQYMEDTYGISMVKDLTGMVSQWEEQEIQGKDAENEEKQIFDNLDEVLDENESLLPAQSNPLPHMEELKKSGILNLVLPKEKSISGRRIRLEDQVSGRSCRTGRGSFPVRTDMDEVTGKLLFNEYILDKFGNAVWEKDGNRPLSYEVEYILEGAESDMENLEAVLKKILLIRTGLNYVYLLTDAAKQAEAETLALTLTSAIGVPVISGLVKQALLAGWAFGEGIMDLRTLMAGKRTALIKNAANWQLELSSLLKLGTNEDNQETCDIEGGIDYKAYLRILLFLENSVHVSMRAMDRMEQNLNYEKGLDFFRADACVTKIRIQNRAVIRNGLTYEFPLYFGYE